MPTLSPSLTCPTATHGHDVPHALVTGDERRVRFDRPVALGGVQVGVADTTGLDPDQYLARPGRGTETSSMTSGLPNSRTTAAFMVEFMFGSP